MKKLPKIKKRYLILISAAIIFLSGMALYFHFFQNLPEFSISILPDLPNPTAGQKIVIFSPHNDDEVLGAGGYITNAVNTGANVTIVFITNGDGHHFSSSEEFNRLYPTPADYIQSGITRQNESKNASKVLGVPQSNIIFLGYPDSDIKPMLDKNWNNAVQSKYTKQTSSPYNNSYTPNVSYTGQNLQNDIVKLLNQIQPNYVFVTPPTDTNPDHAATATFVKNGLNIYDQNQNLKPVLYYYLIHYWHFPYPKGNHPDRFLTPPMRLLTFSWMKYDLNVNTENTKEKSLNEYKSQLKVPMLNSLMQGFIKKNELFIKAN